MVSEQQASKELIVRNWSFTYFEGLNRIDAGLKELSGLKSLQSLLQIDGPRNGSLPAGDTGALVGVNAPIPEGD